MANIITTLALEMNANWYVSKKLNSVGRVGENTVTKLTIEPTEILNNVTYELEIMSADGSKNVAELTIDGTELYLILTANMLTTNGITKMQVRAVFEDGSIKKSNIFELKVNRSISATDYYEEYSVAIFDQLVAECRDIIEGAESYAVRAETAAVNAEAYEQSASASATSASNSATTASTSAETATTAAETATAASVSASTSAETASTAAASASTSASTATSASETAQTAANTATTASETAVNASIVATTAQTSAETAANSASTSANNASASATSAANSASNAAISEANASTSATNAHTSETNATSSANTASTAATSANTSATNAANSATAAATSATNAAVSATNASTSETNASASATEAAEAAETVASSIAQINENTYRINDLEAIIGGYQLTDLPTGEIATITDGTALLMPSLKVGIEPVQDLHGYDHPWAGGAGKNLANIADRSEIVSQTTLGSVLLTAGTYTLSAKLANNGEAEFRLKISNLPNAPLTSPSATSGTFIASTLTFTLNEDMEVSIAAAGSASGYNGSIKDIQIEQGSTATSYEPYSNICPISGWTAANVTRTGKNLYFDKLENASIAANGTFENNNSNTVYIARVKENEKYTFTTNESGVTVGGYFAEKPTLLSTTYNGARLYIGTNTPQTVTIPQGVKYIAIRYLKTFTTPVIEKGTTITTYEPYNGTTYNIQFTDGANPLTVYGGTLDVTSGLLTVTDAYIASYNGETLPSTWISDRDVYAVGTTPTTGAQVCYELENSVTYHLTPAQVRTLVGNNNIWADTGDIIEGKYYRSPF